MARTINPNVRAEPTPTPTNIPLCLTAGPLIMTGTQFALGSTGSQLSSLGLGAFTLLLGKGG